MTEIKHKITIPIWLNEMFENGRLDKNFNPSIQIISIKRNEIKKLNHFDSDFLLLPKKICKFKRKIGNRIYIFDFEECCIYETKK